MGDQRKIVELSKDLSIHLLFKRIFTAGFILTFIEVDIHRTLLVAAYFAQLFAPFQSNKAMGSSLPSYQVRLRRVANGFVGSPTECKHKHVPM